MESVNRNSERAVRCRSSRSFFVCFGMTDGRLWLAVNGERRSPRKGSALRCLMQRAAMAGAACCVGRCSALHLLSCLSAPNLLPPCPPLSMGEKSLLHGSVTSSPRYRVASCIVLWWFSCRRETHFPLGCKFSSMSKPPHSSWGCVTFFIRQKDDWEQGLRGFPDGMTEAGLRVGACIYNV